MSKQMIVRIDPDLKDKVNHYAKAEGKTVSMVVRELLESYVKNRDISAYIDDVWERMGAKIKKRGVSSKKVKSIIKKVRAEK